jgi:putative salt-induced outer membrane protein
MARYLPLAILFVAAPAHAELPPPVRAMVDAAIASGDEAKVKTVVELAKATNPDDAAEVEAINGAFLARKAEERRLAEANRLEAVRTAGVFERWKGKTELGGSRSTGNSSSLGLSAGLDLKRDGIEWTHQFRARADYQRTNGVTSREKYFAAYEPRWQFKDDLFLYGLGQFDRDTFSGFDARYALSAGLGYHAVRSSDLNLSLKAGPALRRTDYTTGEGDTRIAGLVGVDFDWTIADGIKLTQDTNAVAETGSAAVAIFDSRNTTLSLVTGLEARITGKLSTRFSYQLDYQSDPPAGKVGTDTLSRVTLVYGF